MSESECSRLVKVTFNLTSSADDALSRLAAVDGNRTDAINRAIKVAALLHELAPDGRFTLTGCGGHDTRDLPGVTTRRRRAPARWTTT